MSNIKNILSKLDMITEQWQRGAIGSVRPGGSRPGERDPSGRRIEPKFDLSPVQDIAPPMGALGGGSKPRIKVEPGQTSRQAISQAQQKIPTLKQEIPASKPSVDPYGRIEPRGDITGERSFVGKRKDPGGPLPAPSKSNEPTLETNKFPGYWKGTDTAKNVEKKMVGMEEEMLSEYNWLKRATQKLKDRDPYKTYELDDQGFEFSPEQIEWLGGANRQDPDILKRMPGPKPPVSYFKNPEDQRRAQELNFGRQNLNTVRSAVGREKLAPEKFPTSMTSNLGSIRPEIAGMSRDEINKQISYLARLGGGREAMPPADDSPFYVQPSITPSSPSGAPAEVNPVQSSSSSAPATVVPVRSSSSSTPAEVSPVRSSSSSTPAEVSPVRDTRSLSPTNIDPNSGLTFSQDTIKKRTGRAAATGAAPSAVDYRERLRGSSVGAGPGPGLSVPPIETPQLPARPPGSSGAGRGVPPTKRTDIKSSIGNSRNYALSNIGNTSSMAENKHNVVNRLARQFENYLDNRFGIVENNYIPKKKNLE